MKNKIMIFLIGLFLLPLYVGASNVVSDSIDLQNFYNIINNFDDFNFTNKIYSIDINIVVLEDGSANITETWDVDGFDGSEWYKVMNNLGKSEVSDFRVSVDGWPLIYKNWDVGESLDEKRGYYGMVETRNGVELCFGKQDFSRHTFVLSYKLSNLVFNTDDSQVIYFNFIDKLTDVEFDKFTITISSYYQFPSDLDVWGYGYKGYAYVDNGMIGMSNEEYSDMNDSYVVLLAKFPLNTFTSNVRYDKFNNFNDVYTMAEVGSFKHTIDTSDDIIIVIFLILSIFLFFGLILLIVKFDRIFNKPKTKLKNEYGYVNNRIINKKDVVMFREIPCNKDIFYANTLIYLNNFGYKESNILGALLLKWVKDNKIKFNTINKGVLNKEVVNVIDFTLDCAFNNEIENKLYKMFKRASKDGKLEINELETWCYSHSDKYLDLIKKIVNNEKNILLDSKHIWKSKNKEECNKKYVMDDNIYNDSIQLYGLKKYLIEFSNMKEKGVIDVHIWDEYLMFAYLFGIADKVAEQLKNMYPEVVQEMKSINFDYDAIKFVSRLSNSSLSRAKSKKSSSSYGNSARDSARSYSSGGGGFSSGGGGGGSFGGGGGGSR